MSAAMKASATKAAKAITGALSVAYTKIIVLPKAVLAGGALGAIGVIALIAASSGRTKVPSNLKLAFVGNRFLAMNDLPRLVIAMANNDNDADWTQQSCLHSRGSLVTLLETGNGMYGMWNGQENAYNDETRVYDYGACTIQQLFQGTDDALYYQNANGAYYDDGRNPCFTDDDYFTYMTNNDNNNQTMFDYVIFSDHAKRIALAREEAIDELQDTYATYLQDDDAIPIVVSPNAFWSQNSNMTGLDDLATFTALIYEGSVEYAAALSSQLPKQRKARVAPVSLAFLVVYEEDPDLWSMLFDSYDVHASVMGSYLIACILYCTITKVMPLKDQQADVEALFGTARLLTGVAWGYPDPVQAEYLWDVAKRVTKGGYKPKTLVEL